MPSGAYVLNTSTRPPWSVAHDAIVGEHPDETAAAEGRRSDGVPVILQPGAGAAVVEAVDHFGWHDEIRAAQPLGQIIVDRNNVWCRRR